MAEQSTVRIESALVDSVRDYSEKTGVSISRVLDEAVSMWLKNVAPARLKALASHADR